MDEEGKSSKQLYLVLFIGILINLLSQNHEV